ncbi:phosphotransferase [Sulfitobacter sp. M57]|nr:phosphotransferase [Sulfitobacter sp. KE5]MDF3422500.1 phosphotransferase [Sulfitobacter sp. KE43]MDF3433565.1 phosphotransferase [Sulfitobacter sp. KE42]MDF3459205.1 phosphotransferase [Sulfitobacter sp. S74]MDF3463104.1 phosphotransferase [Sulfitobacter sp. Ks18]MDF3467004.1 phosphotransferase [Sulfitobacter sp. M05]MDF3470899.1 phosphotransferase [Sulfitobacter sp. M28]MDF3474648.1 phosphotransferase [Sulfitobacter sp. M48]MDF3478551.1 phosphotransferase [Sulfitobacter sp. M53]MDF348
MENMTERDTEIAGFLDRAGWARAQRKTVAGDASARKYDRLCQPDGGTAILMDAAPETGEDVRPFVAIAQHLRAVGLSAPEVFHQDTDAGLLLIEDFGDALFADLIAADAAQERLLYQAAADVLIHLQSTPKPKVPACDADWLSEMIAPLFEWYAQDVSQGDQAAFGACFQTFAKTATQGEQTLILRDFHAQNLILLPDRTGVQRVGLLDFQDALVGPAAYDLVSILQDARRDVGVGTEVDIVNYVLAKTGKDPATFRTSYAILGLQRNLRILGIFARLCLRDGKAHYVDMIPRVWGYVRRNLAHPELAELSALLMPMLPEPTPIFLERLKRQCPQ